MQAKGLILAGLGPHAKISYYPLIEELAHQYQLKLSLVIDLKSQEEAVRSFLAERAIQPERLLFVDDGCKNSERLCERVAGEMNSILGDEIHGIIISTEPRSHKAYALWAIENNLDIFMDKPITTSPISYHDPTSPQKMYDDYIEMRNALKRSCSHMIIACHRREHDGYGFIRDYVTQIVELHQIPLFYIDIFYANGVWDLPHEFYLRQNHPYKYGYGLLMHSGYHFIDLFAWLLHVNDRLRDRRIDCIETFARHMMPYEMVHMYGADKYNQLFNTERYTSSSADFNVKRMQDLGETDLFLMLQAKSQGLGVTNASINLLHNSFSRRASIEGSMVDWTNGKATHERVSLQVPNLLNIQTHHYQSSKLEEGVPYGEVGHLDHFDIYIFRNANLIGGKPLETFRITKDFKHGEQGLKDMELRAKKRMFLDFIQRRYSASNFLDHDLTIKTLVSIYECAIKQRRGEIPFASFQTI